MKEISRRDLLLAGTSAMLSFPFLSGETNKAMAYEYSPPGDVPFSKEREELNHILAKWGKPRVIKVHDHVYVAVGYTLANTVLVETPEGSVIIDTTESLTQARVIMGEFKQISDKPIRYILYTHNHGDHFRGTKAFYHAGVDIIAHKDFMAEAKLQDSRGQSAAMRSVAMYALLLPPEQRYSMVFTFPAPLILPLVWDTRPEDLIWPNVPFNDRHTFQLGGVTFNLIHSPGETPDQFIVQVPEYKMVCCADNFYPSFPNLYTIRGTSSRPVLDWARAQDTVVALDPEILVPLHGLPFDGKDRIKEVLGNYRDAILHIWKYVTEGIVANKSVYELVANAALPPGLASQPYLQPYYGNIPYCVRAIYDNVMGWFDGDPVNLSPLSRKDLGAEILSLAGSVDAVLAQAEKAQKAGRHQSTLELCEMVLANDPSNKAAREMKITSLLASSRATVNMPTFNYYRIHAAFEKGKLGRS
jgi:alkyl sulfatase BDS1-like metallo-beta-lactamase superfamily hydrolase